MAETDTAVLEPVTTEAAPETEDTAAPELETEGSAETPETEVESEETISKADHEKALAAARKEVEQELRSKAEEEAQQEAAKQRRSQAQQLRQGAGYNRLAQLAQWAHKEGEEGKDLRINPQVLNVLLGEFEGSVFQEQSDAWKDAFDGYLNKSFKDFKLPRDVAGRIQRAASTWNPVELVDAQFAAITAAVREQVEPKLREEIEAEMRDERKTKGLKEADEKRKASARPTEVAGTPAIPTTARAILDSLSPADPKWKAAYKQVHGIDPPR